MRVSGKGRYQVRLRLPQDVGDARGRYLLRQNIRVLDRWPPHGA
jgi:hypothetical protein